MDYKDKINNFIKRKYPKLEESILFSDYEKFIAQELSKRDWQVAEEYLNSLIDMKFFEQKETGVGLCLKMTDIGAEHFKNT